MTLALAPFGDVAAMRRCHACPGVLPEAGRPQVCPRCGGVAFPPIATLDPELVAWLPLALAQMTLRPLAHTEQRAVELAVQMVGRSPDVSRTTPNVLGWTASALDRLPLVTRYYELWRANGAPRGLVTEWREGR
jgi:hypothetical protein